MEKSRLDWAKHFALLGVSVFIVEPNSKRPLDGYSWYLRQTTDAAKIEQWFDQIPNCNYGLHLGEKYVVIDLDVKPDANGVRAFEELCREHGIDDPLLEFDTLIVQTPGGGFHLYFEAPFPCGLSNDFATGIDVRGVTGYVVGPGSEDSRGEWKLMNDAEIAPLPEFLSDYIRPPGHKDPLHDVPVVDLDADENVEHALAWLRDREPAVQGQNGDDHTYETVQFLRDFGLSQGKIFEVLNVEWNQRCDPPWGDDELDAKIRNAWAYGQNRPGVKSPTWKAQRVVMGHGDAMAKLTDHQLTALLHPRTVAVDDVARMKQREWAEEEGIPGEDGYVWHTANSFFTATFPPVEYLIEDYSFIPLRNVTVLDGLPDIGKSTLALNIAMATLAGAPILSAETIQMPVVLVMYEDQMDRVQTMAREIANALGIADPTCLELHVKEVEREEEPTHLAMVGDDGKIDEGPFLKELKTMLRRIGRPCFVVLDTVLEAVWHNQNFKGPTTAALKYVLRDQLCRPHNATVLTTRHPSARSVADGTYAPGDKANLGDVRQTLILEKDDQNRLILRHGKFNAGRKVSFFVERNGNVFTRAYEGPRRTATGLSELAVWVLAEIQDARARNLTIQPNHGGDLNAKSLATKFNKECDDPKDKTDSSKIRGAMFELIRTGHIHRDRGSKAKGGKGWRPSTLEVGPEPANNRFWNETTYTQFFSRGLQAQDGPYRADHLASYIANEIDALQMENSGQKRMGPETEKARVREVLEWLKAEDLSDYAEKYRDDTGHLTFKQIAVAAE